MTIINWQDSNRRFIFKHNADSFINALKSRGHEIAHKYISVDGTTVIVVK